jgi:hypothetical protein
MLAAANQHDVARGAQACNAEEGHHRCAPRRLNRADG